MHNPISRKPDREMPHSISKCQNQHTHLHLKNMTSVEKLYQLIQALPESQVNEILNFAEFLHQKQSDFPHPKAIPPGTLTGLRGIAKRHSLELSNDELQAEYTDYLTQKYQ
jgi:hypothetical protein